MTVNEVPSFQRIVSVHWLWNLENIKKRYEKIFALFSSQPIQMVKLWCKMLRKSSTLHVSREQQRFRRQTTDGIAMPIAQRNVVTFG